jgi:molybdopterin molybdotransferase
MLLPHQALDLVFQHLTPLPARRRPLHLACGSCLAEDICADRDMPATDRAAMDGYAVQARDLQTGSATLVLAGEIPAGQPPSSRVLPGTCVRIMTGASMPVGAYAVVVVEETEESGGGVRFTAAAEPGQNILRQGEDAAAGATLVSRGAILTPLHLGLCEAVGLTRVLVHRRPSVRVLCTGSELREAGQSVRSYQIRNSNGPALTAALGQWGFGRISYVRLADQVDVLTAALSQAIAAADVVLLTGGMSVGRYDLVREAVEASGASVIFHGVAMKPGKPLLYAVKDGDRHLFGLPGPPLSAMTGFFEFVLPALRRLSGLDPAHCRPRLYLPLSTPLASKGGRVRLIPAIVQYGTGGPQVTPVLARSSSDLAGGGNADGVVVAPPEAPERAAGELVEFHPWRPLP